MSMARFKFVKQNFFHLHNLFIMANEQINKACLLLEWNMENTYDLLQS